MAPTCEQVQQDLLDLAGSVAPDERGAALAEHLASCAACSTALGRMSTQAEALRGLSRFQAPADLEDRVTQALTQEGRIERVGRAVASLERRRAHADLEAAVLGGGEMPGEERLAPSVLDRLVDEELAHPLAAQARRALGRLQRMPAPAELASRVENELVQPRASHAGLHSLRMQRTAGLAGLAAAAAFVLWFAGAGFLGGGPVDYGFEIRRVDDLAGLDPMARDLLDGFTGGLLSAKGQR